MQPGSTVATAISKEETGKKYCGILTIREKNFKLRKIELKTTRQVLKQWKHRQKSVVREYILFPR